jgi:Ca-activated chloride channel family protein
MIKLRRLLIALVLFCGLIGIMHPSNAQTQNSQPKQKPGTKPAEDSQAEQNLEIRTDNVRLPITVTEGKSNIFVTNLTEEDFEIYEDKVPQKIIAFAQQSNMPLDVAVLMDTSNSVKPKLKFEKDAAASFLETMLATRKDRALLATFDSQVELHQDFTNRLDLLTTAVYKVKAQGETRMYDAIYQVCEEKMAASPGRRRAMVIITDGEDTVSERTLKEVIDIAQRTETVIFAISTKAGGLFGVQMGTVDRKEDKDLKRMTEETGGRAFFTAEVIELEKSLTAIARELRSQYLIAYQPSNENFDGKYRKIEVKLRGKKDLRLRTKTGYNAISSRSQSAKQSP